MGTNNCLRGWFGQSSVRCNNTLDPPNSIRRDHCSWGSRDSRAATLEQELIERSLVQAVSDGDLFRYEYEAYHWGHAESWRWRNTVMQGREHKTTAKQNRDRERRDAKQHAGKENTV